MVNGIAPQQPTIRRPATVTIAVGLLCLVAALEVGNAVAVFAMLRNDDTFFGRGELATMSTISALFGSALAVVWLVLAWLTANGRAAARVLTWAFAPLYLLFVAGTSLAVGTADACQESPERRPEDWARLNIDLCPVPLWYVPSRMITCAIAAAAVLTAVVALALPATNAYIRRRRPAP